MHRATTIYERALQNACIIFFGQCIMYVMYVYFIVFYINAINQPILKQNKKEGTNIQMVNL